MDLSSNSSQSVITCRNSQGTELTANLLRITRYSVVFEVYNPYSILQLSEVLSDFRIMASRRLLYQGKAVVSNLLNTGIVLVCEAMLDEGWVEVDFLSGVSGTSLDGSANLANQFATFMGEWKSANHVHDPFKLAVADLASTLTGIQHWLTGIDVGIRTTVTRRREDLEQEIFSGIEDRVVNEVLPTMQHFEEVSAEVGQAEVAVHKSYVRRELHPIVLCSPFLYRTYTKPLGYDLVYCAGLFDYLSQRVCKRMVELFRTMLKPGGVVIVTNVATSNPRKAWMEYVMEWNLIYRDENEMMDLVPEGLNPKDTKVGADATGVNLFLEIELADG